MLAAVVGSGIIGDQLSGGNAAIALLANTLATGAALVALILTFGPISGAHFNPAVSIADTSQGGLSWATAAAYAVAQLTGAFLCVGLVPWKRDALHNSRSAAPGWQGAKSELIGHK